MSEEAVKAMEGWDASKLVAEVPSNAERSKAILSQRHAETIATSINCLNQEIGGLVKRLGEVREELVKAIKSFEDSVEKAASRNQEAAQQMARLTTWYVGASCVLAGAGLIQLVLAWVSRT
jgi:seryl-tRNA synthetase